MLSKILVFLAIACVVWFGFRYVDRLARIEKGTRKKDATGVGERSFTERMKRSMRDKKGQTVDSEEIEETERCALCGTYVSAISAQNCGKADCPY